MVNSTQTDTTVIAVIGTIIYLGGFLGNLLSLTIFVPTEIRRVSTGFLFLCLTISNNIHLLALFVEFLEVAYRGKFVRRIQHGRQRLVSTKGQKFQRLISGVTSFDFIAG